MVILNLPDPNEEESAVDYMQFIQILTEGKPMRVRVRVRVRVRELRVRS